MDDHSVPSEICCCAERKARRSAWIEAINRELRRELAAALSKESPADDVRSPAQKPNTKSRRKSKSRRKVVSRTEFSLLIGPGAELDDKFQAHWSILGHAGPLFTPRCPCRSLPLSAHPLASPRLQVRGDLEDYTLWRSGIKRALKFMGSERKCSTTYVRRMLTPCALRPDQRTT